MHGRANPLVVDQTRPSPFPLLKLLSLALTAILALHVANNARAQNLDAEPLFGSISLQTGFESTPYTVAVSPGGENLSSGLGEGCYGYIRFAQPDLVLNYQAGDNPLGVFALSDLDITMAINDPAGTWHCNDDSGYLDGTNSGIQFSAPLTGNYQIWIGSYDGASESIATMLAITEVDESEWASLSIGMEDAIFAASFDLNGDIVFGDDSSGFANDNECDDPRFQGPGMAFGSSSSHLFKDASDCRAQFEASMISLAEPEDMNLGGDLGTGMFDGVTEPSAGNNTAANPFTMPDAGPFGEALFAVIQAFQAIPGDDAVPIPLPFGIGGDDTPAYNRTALTDLTGIDFGDNSGPFSDDGECDDPRFTGPGAAAATFDGAEFTDAGDCSSLYLEGALTYIDPDSVDTGVAVNSEGVNFGDNTGMFPDDGECDDPRFAGPGAAAFTSVDSELRDADDCRSLFESGQITLVARAGASAPMSTTASTSSQASQPAATVQQTPAEEPYTVGIPRGNINAATREDGSIFASGTVYGDTDNSGDRSRNPAPGNANDPPNSTRPAPIRTLDFGDNSSAYANDGECDDPRFEGSQMASVSIDEDRGKDADDCRAAYEAGTITLIRNQ
jgi:hypothetical protein